MSTTASKKPAAKKSAAKKTAKKSTPLKARPLEQIARSKAGLYSMDPTLLSLDPDFNKRIHWGDIPALAEDIAANGLDQPLKIRKVEGTETIYIVAGHRRHRAISLLISQGRWQDEENPKLVRAVPCFSEARHTTKLARLFSQIAGNTGLAYTLLEKAHVYQDALAEDPTLLPADLARHSGESKQAVSDALCLVNQGWNVLIDAVEAGKLSASTAIAIIRQSGENPEEQETLYQAAVANAEKAGRPDHIMPKDVPAPPTADPLKGWKFFPINPKKGTCKLGQTAAFKDIVADAAIKAKGMPPGQALAIGWSRRGKGHNVALSFQGREEFNFRGIDIDRSSPLFTDMPETLDCYIRNEISQVWPDLDSEHLDRLLILITKAAPVFLPVYETSESEVWEYTPSKDFAWNEHDVATQANTATATFPKVTGITRFDLEVAEKNGLWYFGYSVNTHVSYRGAPCSCVNPDEGLADENTAIAAAFLAVARFLKRDAAGHKAEQAIHARANELGNALAARFPTGIPWDESIFSSSSDQPSEINNQESEIQDPKFTLYQISEVPQDPIKEDSPFYHETERVVLAGRPEGITRLHLLSTVTPQGVAFGYRINDHEYLPDISNIETLGEDPEIGYAKMLLTALTAASLTDEQPPLDDALFDFFCRYFPEQGAAEEPEQLTFVAASQAPTEDIPTTGYAAILAAPSTDRSGGSGLGSGGFVSVDKRLKEIEGVMEKVADLKDEAKDTARVATAEILLQVLRNEMPLSVLKDHLTGKA